MSKADLVYRNARICTMDPAMPWASSFAVSNGRFTTIGADDDLNAQTGPDTKVVDCDGAFVLPGLMDSHCHAYEAARADLYEVRLSAEDDVSGLLRSVEDAIDRIPSDRWIKGAGWPVRLIEHLRHADVMAALDRLTGDRPTVLRDSSHHTMFANSEALRLAGVSQSDGVENGSVDRRSDGSLSGILFEEACGLVDRVIPMDSEDARRSSALHAVALYNSMGVTGFVHAATSETTMELFSDLDREGRLRAWVATCIATDTLLTPEREGIGAATIARRAAYRTDHVAVDYVKFFMDGVPGARTAAFIEPYALHDGETALPSPAFTSNELYARIQPLDSEGIRVKVHAVGDKAIRDTLDAIEMVRQRNGADGPQHSIAHVSYIAQSDIKRLSALNVVADLCPPLWFPNPILQANAMALGDARGQHAWSIGDIVAAGTATVLGTDWPIVPSPNPWPGLSGLITRKDPSGRSEGVYRPDQALTLEQALRLCTINVARYMGFETRTGSITVGKSADFAVLDRDLFAIKPEEIADTQVLQTYFAGKAVYVR